MFVSTVIPTVGRLTLTRTIESVLNQSFSAAESEIIRLLANGHGQPEIVAGMHYSMARRVARLAKRIGVEETVFFDGGPALNMGLVEALENELMQPLHIPELPQVTTAYGAALLARESVMHVEGNKYA